MGPERGSALVTGGASGIGRAVAGELVARGHSVVVADVDPCGQRLEDEADVRFVRTDVRDPEQVAAAVAAAEELGPLKFVNLGAGLARPAACPLAVDGATVDLVLGVNVKGTWHGLRESVPALRRAGGGRIVVTASLAGISRWPQDPLYTASKHAVVGLVRALAHDLAAEGIALSALCPGFVDTPLVPDEFREAGFPLLRAENVATAIVDDHAAGGVYVLQPGAPLTRYRAARVPEALAPDGTPAAVPLLRMAGN
ncbi:SDR family NAD(P)-dependent oxidoreductase [Saccharopolyspora sp. WRP15-2]|uniref:SDR family NAD(P)-dependent oxidoreductase n=1 Tax=Saccharopolyspora oryzae TaxID=2997343 RepID=A0ABT4V4E8_9PSEU|nr:SDR family NAD(P)-dependent oxidoreductase [Saccharopolyspora oryzae]MDA3628814.1 SDR family NAD(P)-dependent oxidoreductase [Saccharopolyspora oryzae]